LSLLQIQEDDGLERMKKNGPQDVCYAVLYDVKDADYVRSLDPDSLFSLIYQKSSIFTAISKADDVVTYPGLSFCMQQILGLTVVRFHFMHAGTGLSQARPYQQALEAEVTPVIDILLAGNGSATRSGQALRFVGNFPTSFPTATIRESGVSQVAGPGGGMVLLNRNMFSSFPIAHTAGGTAFTLASLITFSSVTTWL
jgi:hypothetical protein